MIVSNAFEEKLEPDLNERDEEPNDAEERGEREEHDHVELPVVDAVSELHDQDAREAVDRPEIAQNRHDVEEIHEEEFASMFGCHDWFFPACQRVRANFNDKILFAYLTRFRALKKISN